MRRNIIERIYDRVLRKRYNMAVADETGDYSYEELWARSMQIAARLRELNLKKGTAVGVFIPRIGDISACMVACLYCGLAYTPIDNNYPEDRVNYILKDSKAGVVITTRELVDSKHPVCPADRIIEIDELPRPDAAFVEKAIVTPPDIRVGDENLRTAILYTSGTTGFPKGVVYGRKAFTEHILWYVDGDDPIVPANCHVAQVSGFSFIASLYGILCPLLVGGCSYIISEKMRLDVVALYKYVKRNNVTNLLLPPAMGKIMVEKFDCRGITVLLAGEKVPAINPLYKTRLYNMYGSTEGCVVAAGRINCDEEDISIGYPTDGVKLFLLDENLNPVPDGQPGEVVYNAGFMASEYLNLPELTSQKWITYEGMRVFRTGDRMRKGDDGRLYFDGRTDFMFKIRGLRVESGEVENKAVAAECVKGMISTAVCVKRTVEGEDHVCLFYEGSQDIDEEALKSELGAALPAYMIPDYFVRLDKLPRNANGKVSRDELPQINAGSDYINNTSIEAMRIAADIFFEHSVTVDYLQILNIHGRSELDEYIAKCIAEGMANRDGGALGDEPEVEKVSEAPLTYGQKGIYFECMENPKSLAYNLPTLIPLPNSVTEEQLNSVLSDFIKAHPYLNTGLKTAEDGNIVQYVKKTPDSFDPIKKISLSEEELRERRNNLPVPFNLLSGEKLYAFKLIQTEERKYLFADFHHIIFDGSSYNIFLKQFKELLSGKKIKAEKYGYYNYAADQAKRRAGKEHEEVEAYWDGRMSIIDEMTSIIPDLHESKDNIGAELSVYKKVDNGSVEDIAKKLNIQRSSVYLGAAIYALAAYTNEENIGIVTVSGGRQRPETANACGMFVNTLPFTVKTSDCSVEEYLTGIQTDLRELIAHDEYSYSDFVTKYGLRADVMFAYQESLIESDEKSRDYISIESGEAKFPLQIEISHNEGNAVIRLRYDSCKYSLNLMENLADTINYVLNEMSIKEYLHDIEFSAEKLVITGDNKDELVGMGYKSIPEAFKESVARYPDNTAIAFEEKKITYSEADRISDKIALLIDRNRRKTANRARGIVSIIIHRDEYMILAPLGAMKAGCAYQPVDPAYPDERIKFMVQDADADLLITTDDLAERFKELGIKMLTISQIENSREEAGCDELKARDFPKDDLFVLLYTSGSTGTPKGVMLENRNISAFINWYGLYYNLRPDSKVMAYASFGFDANMMDMYPAILYGAAVYIIPEKNRLDMKWISDYIEKEGITHAFVTTQIGINLAWALHPNTLKYLSVGGEALSTINAVEGCRVYNGYGPTECTIFSTIKEIVKPEEVIPIGKSVGTLGCFVADKNLRVLPRGASGELIITGNQVGRGYLNQPEKTKESFFTYDGIQAYHSGDIVRIREDGDIEYICRRDGMVKIRGFRIELGEVENVIKEYPGIEKVTVQAFDNASEGKFMAAYLVSSDKIDISDLKKYIAGKKPSYMVPRVLMQIDEIPLNVNQKVDKKRLPAPVIEVSSTYVAPSGKMEEIIAKKVGEVLGLGDAVSTDTGFIELGGNSINAVRLSGLLSDMGVSLGVREILQSPSIKDMARFAEEEEGEIAEIEQGPVLGPIMNTPIIDYFFNLKLKNPDYFTQALLYRLAVPVPEDILREAVTVLTNRHDMLRAVVRDGSLFVREPGCDNLFTLEEIDASKLYEEAERLLRGISVTEGPLIRMGYFTREGSKYLYIAIHHLLVDGISWRVLSEEMGIVCKQLMNKEEVSLPQKTGSYKNYSEIIERFKHSIVQKQYRKEWNETRIKMSRMDKSEGLKSGCISKCLQLDENHTDLLLHKCIEVFDADTNVIMLSAVGMAYGKVSGRDSVSVRLEGHGRPSLLSLSRSVGWFTSIYPAVLEMIDRNVDPVIITTRSVLRRIPEQGISYPMIYGIETENLPLITFNYLGDMDGSKDDMLQFAAINDLPSMIDPANNYGTDISINGLMFGGKIQFNVDFNRDRYTEDEAVSFIDSFEEALSAIISRSIELDKSNMSLSDFGEYEWGEKDFVNAFAQCERIGETIKAISPLSKEQERMLFRSICMSDISDSDQTAIFEIDCVLEKEIVDEAMEALFKEYQVLQSMIIFKDVSIPRLVQTDKKPVAFYRKVTSEDEYRRTILEAREHSRGLYRVDRNESPMQIEVISTDDKSTIVVYADEIIIDKIQLRKCLTSLMTYLGSRVSKENNLLEWAQMLDIGIDNSRKPDRRYPKTQTEKYLVEIVADLFNACPTDIYLDTDIISLGADDFICMDLSGAIQRRFGKLISTSMIHHNPTIRAIAGIIDEGDESEGYEDIHIYQEPEGKKLLFFAHTANTGSEAYALLAEKIKDTYGFAVFEQYNFNHPNSPATSIETLAEKYISVMRKVQPEGPYYLGGWCFGGTIAYEMSRQLALIGQKTEKLILLDSHIISDDNLRERVRMSSGEGKREYFSTSPLFEDFRRKGILERLIRNSEIATGAWLDYKPEHTDVDALYFKAVEKEENLDAVANDMYDYVLAKRAAGFEKCIDENRLTIVDVDTSHDSMMSDSALEQIVPVIKDYMG